jgi:hypothetical protein
MAMPFFKNPAVQPTIAEMTDDKIEAELEQVAVKLADADANGSKIGELQARLFRLRSEKAFRRSKEGPMGPVDEISQAERRKVLENDRKVRATYFQHAQSDPELELGGRFVKLTPTSVTGTGPSPIPQQPPTSPANQAAMVPDEPLIDGTGEGNTLGYAIDRPGDEGSAAPVEPTSRMDTAGTAAAAPALSHVVTGAVAVKSRRRM